MEHNVNILGENIITTKKNTEDEVCGCVSKPKCRTKSQITDS
jgi:hypothetical protein